MTGHQRETDSTQKSQLDKAYNIPADIKYLQAVGYQYNA